MADLKLDHKPLARFATRAIGLACPLLLTAAALVALRVPLASALSCILSGAFGSSAKLSYVLTAWVPLLLCSAGLLVTFTAGLWNIGIEGQVVMGAVFASWILRASAGSLAPSLSLALSALSAAGGAALFALAVGLLRRHGKVNEIFGGLGLNFIAGSLTVYLVMGPWKRPGIASSSGTEPFDPALWLSPLGSVAVSPIELALGLLALLLVGLSLRNSRLGLSLVAVGLSPGAALRLGVRTERILLGAFSLCGALAGLAGWVLVVGVNARHNLFPLISGGMGFLSILAVLLSGSGVLACLLVTFFFAAISMGSLQLGLQLQLDSALGGVVQGLLVLAVLLVKGLRERFLEGRA